MKIKIPPLRLWSVACASVMLAFGACAAADEAVPLNDYVRLGQRFTATRPIVAVWLTVPSWSDSEGGLTVALWDSPERRQKLASDTLTGIQDNARVELALPRPLPAGTYYWEVSERTGSTRIGLYCRQLPAPSADCAYFDGKPDPLRSFISGTTVQDYVRVEASRLSEVLTSDASVEDKVDACRALASLGNASSVPALAALLDDRRLAHMARFALQAIPDRAADGALRRAAARLEGDLLVGVLNTIGARRDERAVGVLSSLLASADPSVASAAASAMARIGSPACASALTKQLDRAPEGLRGALEEACLECAVVLAKAGHRGESLRLYDRLRARAALPAVRRGALIGAILVRESKGVALALDALQSDDPDQHAAAMWCVQRGLQGRSSTVALGASLDALAVPKRIALISALGARGDPAATAALEAHARDGDSQVRVAAIVALGRLAASDAAAVLVGQLRDADPTVAGAAASALAALPRAEVQRTALALLKSNDRERRLRGVALASETGMTQLAGELLSVAKAGDREVGLAALRALRDLGGAGQFPGIVELLTSAQEPDAVSASEEALTAICGRVAVSADMAPVVVASHAHSRASQRLALLRVLGACGGPTALDGVIRDLSHSDQMVRREAESVLCGWRSIDAAPALLELARRDPASGDSIRALRGVLRLASDPEAASASRLAICKDAAPLVRRDDETRMLLSVLDTIHSGDAAHMIVPRLAQDSVRVEAAQALIGVVEHLSVDQLDSAIVSALEQVSRWTDVPEIAKRAREQAARAAVAAPTARSR